MTSELTPTAFAALQSNVDHIKSTLDRLVGQVEPVLLARSGDLASISSIQRDVAASHEKHREHMRRMAQLDERLDELERRFDRAQYLVVGAMAAIQVLWGLLGPYLLRVLGIER